MQNQNLTVTRFFSLDHRETPNTHELILYPFRIFFGTAIFWRKIISPKGPFQFSLVSVRKVFSIVKGFFFAFSALCDFRKKIEKVFFQKYGFLMFSIFNHKLKCFRIRKCDFLRHVCRPTLLANFDWLLQPKFS